MPPIRRPEERIAATLGQLTPGTLGGTARGVARPPTPVGELRTPGGAGNEIAFHLPGPVTVSTSDEWPPPRLIQPVRFRVRLTVAGSSTTTVVLYDQADTTVASVSFASGVAGTADDDTMAVGSIPDTGAAYVGITAAGTGAEGVVAVLEYR